ncbi:unnamed protein product [Closterium sp. NIES-64]|nr:unnamed protein product [Closterium sp. NIES-64]
MPLSSYLQLQRGFGSASQILLSGSSAGGQATANLCDWLASSFPSASTRCLVDSGFFLDTKDRSSKRTLRITTHPSSLFLFTPQPTQSPPHPLLAPCQRLAQETFAGVLSSNERINPLFHNWNLVRLLYCDGGGYAGTRGRINRTDSYSHPSTAGTSPKSAVLQDLQLQRGFGSASQILLSGSSAGGQATANLCDWLASLFPSASTRCLVDAGFFLDTRDRFSRRTFQALAQKLTLLHRPVNPTCSYGTPTHHPNLLCMYYPITFSSF